jgi:hypothetical protein
MKGSRLLFALGFAAALALAAREVGAQGDQSDIISAHGDALARSTSAPALVQPMPKGPPNSALPVVPSAPAAATPPAATPPAAAPPVAAPQGVPAAPAAVSAAPQSSPAPAEANPAPATAPLPSQNEGRRYVLIVAGALVALAMFLWERRRKD